jgi:hypothetical protein
MSARRRLAVFFLALAISGLAAAQATAELTAHGDLFVKFSGGIAPKALPRDRPAPISIQIGGIVRTLSGERPPALRQISIAINQGGKLDSRGLPTCRRGQIDPSTTKGALAACGPALIGRGSYTADIAFPEQSSFPSKGRILAFNAVVGGQRAILAHVYGANPLPITRVVVFHVRHTQGTYGTVLTAALPKADNPYGYLTSINLGIHRTFLYGGHTHSYLSAACAAPAGFGLATFRFAHASMRFADGRTLASTLIRSCRVRSG